MADNAPERCHRVRLADLGDVGVAGDTIFGLPGEAGGDGNRRWALVLVPEDKTSGQE